MGFELELPKKKRGWPKKLGKVQKVVVEEDDEVFSCFSSLLDFFCSLFFFYFEFKIFHRNLKIFHLPVIFHHLHWMNQSKLLVNFFSLLISTLILIFYHIFSGLEWLPRSGGFLQVPIVRQYPNVKRQSAG